MRYLLGVGLAIVLAGSTHAETSRWQSDRALWCDAARLASQKPRALNNCALGLLRDGEYDSALPLLDRALVTLEDREPGRRASLRATVQTNRFLVLYALRRNADALASLEAVDPADPRVVRFREWVQ